MASPFDKDFDTILTEVLTDYSNLDSAPDVSQGSMPYIMGSVLSSMVWGLYRYQDYINKMHFPDTADTDNLNHWGSIYDITRLGTDTNVTYLNKILSFIRQPPAGGNIQDFEDWALDQDECFIVDGSDTYYNAFAKIVDIAEGVGTVGIYTIPDDETIIDVVGPPNNEELLRVATENYIETVRPLGMVAAPVYSAKPVNTDVTMDLTAPTGVTLNTAEIKIAIQTEMNSMEPGQSLFHSTLNCIALSYGAANSTVTLPAGDPTTATNLQFIRPGTILFT